MRIFIIIVLLLLSGVAKAETTEVILLHPPQIDDYERHKEDYDRLGLSKGAPRSEACVKYKDEQALVLENLPLFDVDGSFKYKNAVLHSINIKDSGFCLSFAGLNNGDFETWIKPFIANNSSVVTGNYVVEFK
jgi:hypothetical protein